MRKLVLVILLWVAAPCAAQMTFQQRCAQPGVVRCIPLQSPSEITGVYGDNTGIALGDVMPMIDTTVFPPNDGVTGSLKFSIPAGFSGNTDYFANFSADLSVQFDTGQDFYIQWRQRMDANFVAANPGTGTDGWKQIIVTEGDRPGTSQQGDCQPLGNNWVCSSCVDIGVITQNSVSYGIPQMYHSCGVKDGMYEGLSEPTPPPLDYRWQNMPRSPGCLRSRVIVGDLTGCFAYVANEWLTFQYHIRPGTWYQNWCYPSGCAPTGPFYNHDSIVQLWVARQGQGSQLIMDFSPQSVPDTCHLNNRDTSEPACQTGYDLVNFFPGVAKYGKLWLTPRIGNCNPPPGTCALFPQASNTWYGEIIISHNRILDP